MQKEFAVAEAEQPKPRGIWRRFDLAHAILMAAALLAIAYSVKISLINSELLAKKGEYYGTLSGPIITQEGDIVPGFKTIDLQSNSSEIIYNGTRKYLFFIFSPMCGICQQEISLWNSLASIATSKKIMVRGISIDSLEDSQKIVPGQDIVSSQAKESRYLEPTSFKVLSSCSSRSLNDSYADSGSHSYFSLRHRISIKFSSGL